ncbi:polyprenal reductase isoform X1 [Gouania willdenowi]|uniref:Polyprenal reductase n=1 Tax=Gouania willdenowi TaxID=441366 RepID=A0A8C5G8B7_GOUWI|nr:polyprenol reductase isoform X1 [Gouania willdenowi]
MSMIDVLWCFLAFCFFVAFSIHGLCEVGPGERESGFMYVLFQDLIRYGKTKQSLRRSAWLRVFDVPKRWFWHFYVISVCWNGFLLVLTFNCVYVHQPLPVWLTAVLEALTGVPGSHSAVPRPSTILLQLLLFIHSFRRLLECLLISVFSDGVIHLAQYAFGLGYYIVLGLTALCSDLSAKGSDMQDWLLLLGCAVFIWASLLQHRSMVLLAQLRTGKSGTVETLVHRVPNGGWFELVSCPHYFAELLIYVSLSLVSGGLSLTWWLVVLYVFFNQALAAQLCHELYVSKYESYPKNRNAFIPFVL